MSNSLASVHPELISEWSEKNLPLTPDKITFGSNKRVWWKGACGHEWETSVKGREMPNMLRSKSNRGYQ
ncbi:TPA: zinc-ribbon domain-containing protein [Streptococcus suis]|nr:zinc-ribbon domain-containing protein [Streptococcus suis]